MMEMFLIFVAIEYYNKEEGARGMKGIGSSQNLVISLIWCG
jgi:hypothetical protein